MGKFIGTGTIVKRNGTSIGCITEVSGPGPSRESIDFTCMDDSANRQFYPSKLVDWGECTISIAYDPTVATIKGIITAGVETWTIEFSDGVDGTVNDTWSFSAFCTGIDPTTPLEGKATADVTIKITGGVTTAA